MNTHSANALFHTINRIAKPKYRLGLGDWLAASAEQRTAMDLWCAQHNYELVIDAADLGEMNDHVRDMEPTKDHDKLELGHDDYEVTPPQGSSR